MSCYTPITGWKSKAGRNPNGSWPVVFNPAYGYKDMEVKVPCGKCIGCLLERSRQWAIRCVHEAKMYKNNCFVTLTYDDAKTENKERIRNINKKDFILFMKKLRKKKKEKIRFFHCGEYGSKNGRAHHHVCLFNCQFTDKKLWKIRNGVPLYRSEELEKLWQYGFSTIGDVTFESAAYVARYCLKKAGSGEGANALPGSEAVVKPYITMSRKPGISSQWLDRFGNDAKAIDGIIIRGLKSCMPKYYNNKLYSRKEKERIALRKKQASNPDENTWERLQTKKQLQKIRADKLKRSLDYGNA